MMDCPNRNRVYLSIFIQLEITVVPRKKMLEKVIRESNKRGFVDVKLIASSVRDASNDAGITSYT